MAGSGGVTLPPVRLNGQRIEASWFNSLRDYLSGSFGGLIPQQTYTLDNATSVALTEFTFDAAENICAKITYYASRQSNTDPIIIEKGELFVLYDGTDWTVSEGQKVGGDAGVTWSITAANPVGVLSYSSSTYSVTGYVGRLDLTAQPFLI